MGPLSFFKNLEKTFEEGIDKGGGMWYNNKAVQKAGVEPGGSEKTSKKFCKTS